MKSSNQLPLLFVFLWSSAYIAFEFCAAYIEPATFVVIRTTLTANILLLIIVCTKTEWPGSMRDVVYSVIVGVLMHGLYAGGLYVSIYRGIDVALAALILSLQPLLTVLLSSIFLKEKLTTQKIFGVLAGLTGVSLLIVEDRAVNTAALANSNFGSEVSVLSVVMCFVALFSISIATIVQKRYCTETKIMSGACIQYTAAAIFLLPFALLFESMQIEWSLQFVLGMSWLVVIVSIGAMSLLMLLINHGEAGSVANLFYLVTPLVALQAWLLFDDKLTFQSIIGMLICLTGVIAVNYTPATKARRRALFGSGYTTKHTAY